MSAESFFHIGSGRDYCTLLLHEEWARSHRTHPVVAAGIHSISGHMRVAEDIFQSPTADELRAVAAFVSGLIISGELMPDEGGSYPWGVWSLVVLHIGARIDGAIFNAPSNGSGRVVLLNAQRVLVAWDSGKQSWETAASPWVHIVST